MKTRTAVKSLAGALGVALTVAACGGSKAPGVVTAPSAGATQQAIATTPTPPPALSTKPVVTVPKTPAPTRLVTTDLVTGTGKTAAPGQTVTVNYVGVLYKTGKEFDSSWKRNTPFTTALSSGSVIPGWVQGLSGMKVGGRRELIIPPNLAYKSAAQPGIPANSTLVFVVDLLSVA